MSSSDEPSNPLAEALQLLELDLQLPRGFLASLYAEESDWAFVIKAHALVEAALTHLIVTAIGDQRLGQLIGCLETSNGDTGKLAFVKKMELLPERYRRFLKGFSELRNSLVHDVSNSNFTFESHLGSLSKDKRKTFKEVFSYKTRPRPDAPQDDWEELVLKDPRLAIFLNVFKLLAEAYQKKQTYLIDDEDIDGALESGEGE